MARLADVIERITSAARRMPQGRHVLWLRLARQRSADSATTELVTMAAAMLALGIERRCNSDGTFGGGRKKDQ